MSNAALHFFDNKKTLVVKPKKEENIDSLLLEKLHIQALLNLMKSDAMNSKEEIEFIAPIIEYSNLNDKEKEDLKANLKYEVPNFF